eukprot:Skav208452  [mRNA]  locus=scaffold1104:62840:63124:+ [translate_table: standard]
MSNAELVARLERQFAGSGGPAAVRFAYCGYELLRVTMCCRMSRVDWPTSLDVPGHFCISLHFGTRQLVKSAEVRIRHRREQEKKAADDIKRLCI